ncbi:MAG: kinase/pyrophosphorylase [Coriobacteriales bacterium]|nr:kinase/pyrophosphorylase [Coriobacteriales bacterium]
MVAANCGETRPLTIHILSDSLGETADAVAKAAAAQFEEHVFVAERLPWVSTVEQLRDQVELHCGKHCIFFYTLVKPELTVEMRRLCSEKKINGVDILGPSVELLARCSGVGPLGVAGAIRQPDEAYFDRIDAMEFAIKHDDGRNPDGLIEADIVLIGVSRTSKTPLSIYLASKGYKVANVALVKGTDPPDELFEVDPRRVFGLTSSPDTLADIRSKRMAELGTFVAHYADLEDIELDLKDARDVMRRIGSIVVRTDNRAVEETAQEIIRYLRGQPVTQD